MNERPIDREVSAEQLLVEIGSGDLRAFHTFYDRAVRPVRTLARELLDDDAQAEEVAQEVLIEVWRTAPRYRPDRGSAQSWVSTMTRRRSVDRLRSARAVRERDDRFAAGSQETAYDSVTETVLAHCEHLKVRSCLSALTALQSEAVLLTYYRGLSYREAAEQLRIPPSTVKTRLRDGLLRLRECLGDCCLDSPEQAREDRS